MYKTVIDIAGIHCRSCEFLIETALLEIKGVKKVRVDQHKGLAEIDHEGQLNESEIERAVRGAGYCLGRDEKPFLSKNPKDYRDLGLAVFLVLDLYLVAKALGIFNLNFVSSNNYNSLPVIFLIGLTAGVSTCMALVGGLVLGASARFAEKHPTATPLQKFKPHLFFNLGRIISYFLLGGLIGYAGSFFQLSTSVLGILTISVGLVMLLLGAQLIEIFPILRGFNFTLPKEISRFLGLKDQSAKEYSHKNSMVMGAMTFFLPCGFTQAIQLYAISSGSPVTGALALGTFALGTAPGLLGVGGLTSIIKGTASRLFFRSAGLIVILLALFNINNGYNLSGFNPDDLLSIFGPSKNALAAVNDPNVNLENGVQVVKMNQDSSGYRPNSFTIKKGIPVRWVITSTDSYTCAASIVMSKYNIRQSLQTGENIIEFTPIESGTLPFSCSMGMYRGTFNVIDSSADSGQAQVQAVVPAPAAGGSCGSSGGCGCGGGAGKAQPVVQAQPSEQIQQDNVQILKTTYTQANDIRPNSFTVKAGTLARLEVTVNDDGYGCMGSFTIPGLTNKVEFMKKGTVLTFELDTSKAGKYPITCGMGVPRGEIVVQ